MTGASPSGATRVATPERLRDTSRLMVNPKDVVAKALTRLHQVIFQTTKGRIGGTGFGMPVLTLRTTGRRSGKTRETMLTSPVQDGEKVILVASYGGDNRHPTWFLNLR